MSEPTSNWARVTAGLTDEERNELLNYCILNEVIEKVEDTQYFHTPGEVARAKDAWNELRKANA